jgi:hypothetical protein
MTAKHQSPPTPDEAFETDAVWQLLEQATPSTASPRFAADTLRVARLLEQPAPWWKRIFAPAPLAGLAAATAAIAFAVVPLLPSRTVANAPALAALDSPQAVAIQDIAETETLVAAVDQMDDFSDNELVSLIGF